MAEGIGQTESVRVNIVISRALGEQLVPQQSVDHLAKKTRLGPSMAKSSEV